LPSNVLRFDAQNNPPQAASLHWESTVVAFRHDAVRFAQHDALDARRSVASLRDDHPDRAPRAPRVVAVGVLSYPTIRSSPRERTLGLRDCPPRERAAYVNGHVRTISRVVVHPQFRGLGLASELVRKLIAVCPTRYVEAAAVMAHVHPFFAAAGMRQGQDDQSESNDTLRPAYFIFDKTEGSPCKC
jgi:GNAT superfamily N-acetyltransferase